MYVCIYFASPSASHLLKDNYRKASYSRTKLGWEFNYEPCDHDRLKNYAPDGSDAHCSYCANHLKSEKTKS